MSIAILASRAQLGIEAPPVTIEVFLSGGLPRFNVVGMPETAVRESSDRVRGAIINSGLPFPRERITVSLAPADMRKTGGRFDLYVYVEDVDRVFRALRQRVRRVATNLAHGGRSTVVGAGQVGGTVEAPTDEVTAVALDEIESVAGGQLGKDAPRVLRFAETGELECLGSILQYSL